MRNENVTGLLPPPTLSAVQPARVVLAGTSVARVKLRGSGFTERVSVELVERLSGRIYPLIQVVRLDAETLRGDVSPALVPSGTYDVRVISSDEQEGVLPGALTVRLAPR